MSKWTHTETHTQRCVWLDYRALHPTHNLARLKVTLPWQPPALEVVLITGCAQAPPTSSISLTKSNINIISLQKSCDGWQDVGHDVLCLYRETHLSVSLSLSNTHTHTILWGTCKHCVSGVHGVNRGWKRTASLVTVTEKRGECNT